MEVEGASEIVQKWIQEKQNEAKSEELEKIVELAQMEDEEEMMMMPKEWTVMADVSNNNSIRKITEWVCKKKGLALVSVIGGLSQSIPVVGTFYAILFIAKDQEGKRFVYEAVVYKIPLVSILRLLSCMALIPI